MGHFHPFSSSQSVRLPGKSPCSGNPHHQKIHPVETLELVAEPTAGHHKGILTLGGILVISWSFHGNFTMKLYPMKWEVYWIISNFTISVDFS
jgi:hypothetical protein